MKGWFPFPILQLLTVLVHAQVAPIVEWEKRIGGNLIDQAYSIQQTTDGGYIVAGTSNSFNGEVSNPFGFFYGDYWIVKLDSAGDIMWQKSLGGSQDDEAYSIDPTDDGGFIVAGFTNSNDSDVTGNHGGSDYWIIKLNASGDIKWQKCLGGSGTDKAYSIQQTSEKGFIVAGSSTSSDGNVTEYHGGFYGGFGDYWVVKLDSIGGIQWQKSLGGSSDEMGHSIQETPAGGFLVAGYSFSNNGNVTGNHGFMDYWVVKLDEVGNLVWEKCYGGTNSDYESALQVRSDGTFLVAGKSRSTDGDVSENRGDDDYWIVKSDNSGNILWQKSYGGSKMDFATSIISISDGSCIVGGYTASMDGDVIRENNAVGSDYWIIKIDPLGNLVWSKVLDGPSSEYLKSIDQTEDGGLIAAGYTEHYLVEPGYSTSRDYWIVKLSRDTPIITEDNKPVFYPNPCNGFLMVVLSMEDVNNLIIVTDITGKIISPPITFFGAYASINTSNLANGLYTLQVVDKNSGKTSFAKFVKAN